MAEPAVEAFILYNERESQVQPIVEQLQAKGINTFFFPRDIAVGAPIDLDRSLESRPRSGP